MNTELVWLWVTVPISAKVRTAEGEGEAINPSVRSGQPLNGARRWIATYGRVALRKAFSEQTLTESKNLPDCS